MLTHVPLLKIQRDLYDLPRGRDRFDAYIATLRDESGEIALPLGSMNPMGKDHIPALLDDYLAFGADGFAQEIIESLTGERLFGSDRFRTALVLADDAHGQWTNRVATDFTNRYETRPMFRRGWLIAQLWTSAGASAETVKQALLESVYRGVFIHQNGYPADLHQLILQEGFAAKHSGRMQQFDRDEIDYTQSVLEPLFTADDTPTLIVALFGDEAAAELGHRPLGLSTMAGIELGLHLQDSAING